MSKKIQIIIGTIAAATLVTSCVSRGNNTGWEYAPDMYYSKGYEPYNQGDSNVINPHGMSMREPVAGSIAYGKADFQYPLPNSGEGYEASATQIVAPADLTDADGRGKYLYNIYCTPCHGANGANDGEIFKKVATLKPAGWKAYTDEYIKTLPEGKIYHTLTYGKNNMGSHASVLKPVDRWRVIKYVKQLSAAAPATADAAAPQDSTKKK